MEQNDWCRENVPWVYDVRTVETVRCLNCAYINGYIVGDKMPKFCSECGIKLGSYEKY